MWSVEADIHASVWQWDEGVRLRYLGCGVTWYVSVCSCGRLWRPLQLAVWMEDISLPDGR